MIIEHKHLHAALVLARYCHFGKAAKELGISQPALSRIIRLMEEDLGEKLFDRRTRLVSLTSIGEYFIEFAGDMVEYRAQRLGHIRQLIAAKHGQVTLACIPSIAIEVVRGVKRFSEENPDVKVRIIEASTAEVVKMIKTGVADWGLAILLNEEPDISSSLFRVDSLVAAGCLSDPLAKKKSIRWSDLSTTNIITTAGGSSIRHLVEQVLTEQKIENKLMFEADLISTVIAMAREGMGTAVLPSVFTDALESPDIFIKPLNHPTVKRDIMLLRYRKRMLLPAALKMEKYLQHRK